MVSILNKQKVITDILLGDFSGNIPKCSKEIGVTRQYFLYFLKSETARPGRKLLDGIYQYCLRSGKDPAGFFFSQKA